jgi:hypothetical protein
MISRILISAIAPFAISSACGECTTGAGTKGWYVTDYANGRPYSRCAQCDGRVGGACDGKRWAFVEPKAVAQISPPNGGAPRDTRGGASR